MVYFKQFINDVITEVSYRTKEGTVNFENPDHISILSEVLDEMGLSDIKNELFNNLFEEEKRFSNPILNRKVRYRDEDGEEKEGIVGNLLRKGEDFPGREAAEKIVPKEGTPQRDKLNAELGSEKGGKTTPPPKEDDKDKESEDTKEKESNEQPSGASVNIFGDDYKEDLPDEDPASQEEIDELLEEFFTEDEELLTEASYLDTKYKPGHQIIFNKENPPKWAPKLQNGDVLTLIEDDESIVTYGDGEFVKTLQLPDGKKVRIASSRRDGGNANLFIHSKKGGATPSGEDWEALIICAYNGIDETSAEWKRAQVFWPNYGDDAKNIAKSFKRIIKSGALSQLGSSTAALNSDWGGKNKTPKTDILGDKNEKISLKKAGGSQLMSGSKEEALATFHAAMKMVGANKPKLLKSFLDNLETKMGKMSENGTITALQKLRDSGEKLTPEQEKTIAEMEKLQLNAKEINKDMETIFKDIYFKSCFCFEAATGTNKFADKNAIANKLIEFDTSGKITAHMAMNQIDDARTLAKQNSFYVSFKTGGTSSKPYLALRTKKVPKSKLVESSFRDIIHEEFSKFSFGEQLLSEGDIRQLNEFQIFNKLVRGVKNVSNRVKNQVKQILNNILKRTKEAINFIKSLGSKMFQAIMNFLGLSVQNVSITSSGPFKLR